MSSIKGLPVPSNNVRDLDKNRNTKKSEAAVSKTSDSVSLNKKAGIKDSVNISNVAREMMQQPTSVEALKVELDNIKTLDRSTLKEIHGKIESNYYDKPEVIDQIVDAMIPEAHSVDEVEAPAKTEENTLVAQIQENIENGKYDSEEVLNTIVDRMLNPDNILM
jgi:anti-sigma28 factor (negative regulator of flagellin synthesis)